MKLLDVVRLPKGGVGIVVGFPIAGSVEVRNRASGQLDIFTIEKIEEANTETVAEPLPNESTIEFETKETIPVEDDVPRSSTGRKLTGVALKKHLAKLEQDRTK